MPMNWDIRECKNLTDKTKEIFFSGIGIYSPFETLCNWLYQTKFSYGDRKRDSYLEDNHVVLIKDHVPKIIKVGLFEAVNPKEYNKETLKLMLLEFVGLKVYAI